MAIVSDGYAGTVVLVDNGNNTATRNFELTGATLVDALADLVAIVASLEAITDAVVKSYAVSERYVENALTLPIGGVQVENTASVSALIAGTVDKYARFIIPAPVAGLFTGSSGPAANVVDATDADLLTYLGHFVTGGEATVSDGEVISTPSVATVKGKRVHRGSRKG